MVRWSIIVGFILGTTAMVLLVFFQFLLPAAQVARDVDEPGRRQIAALAWLVLAVLLICVLFLLILTMRLRRLLVAQRGQSQRTEYVDAWAEAGKRLEPPGERHDEDG